MNEETVKMLEEIEEELINRLDTDNKEVVTVVNRLIAELRRMHYNLGVQ